MRALLFAILLGAACAASAQLYRWTDQNGRVHITDTPPPPGAKGVQRRAASVGGTVAAENLPYAVQTASKNFPVTLYTAPECEPCGAARKLLNARGVTTDFIWLDTDTRINIIIVAEDGTLRNIIPSMAQRTWVKQLIKIELK